jgi:four helix bundle protein
MMSYEKLEVYQLSIQFLTLALQIAQKIPPTYSELADQLKRAAMGPPRNIGEGAGKRTPADCRKYFDIARGSAMECGVHLDVCTALSLVEPALIERGKSLLEREVAMLTRLSQSQGRQAR